MSLQIAVDEAAIQVFCQKHHIKRLSFFGSVLRGDFLSDSDVDVLVEFEEGHVPGLAFFGMQEELSEVLGHRADLNTPNFLSPHFRSKILAETEVCHVAA